MQLLINKAANTAKALSPEKEMAAINAFAQRELSPEEVFVFRVRACNDQVDRDFERFPADTLHKLAPMFVGKPGIADHKWSAGLQKARIYDAFVETQGGVTSLIFKCYMLRNDSTKDWISAIEGGILREVSVGCSISRAVCSICGGDAGTCQHHKGAVYNGRLCVYELWDPVDAYEFSFVAVPAQPGAGVTKESHNHGWTPAEMAAAKVELEIEHERWK